MSAELIHPEPCPHSAPDQFGASEVHWRQDGTAWVHTPCAQCGAYRVWELEEL